MAEAESAVDRFELNLLCGYQSARTVRKIFVKGNAGLLYGRSSLSGALVNIPLRW